LRKHQDFYELFKRIAYIEDELKTRQEKKPTTQTQPQVTKKHQAIVANASTQTEKKIAAEKMEIEIKERRWIRCSSVKKKIFYTKLYFAKKTDREEMEVEEERVKKTRKCHKTSVIKARPKTRWHKTDVKKEMMAIEKIENTEAASKSPPKKGNPGVKTKPKGTPYAP